MIFVDTSSTYFEIDVPDPLVELDTTAGEREAREQAAAGTGPEERATRRFNKHSKDKRPDLPQVVLGMAVTAEGIPIRCWTFPGTTSDQAIIKTIKDDLSGWMLNRVVWVADSGFNSADNQNDLPAGHRGQLRNCGLAIGLIRACPPQWLIPVLPRPGRHRRAHHKGNLEIYP